MIDCHECKRVEVCSTCGEKVCRVHRSKIDICKIVGYYNEDGKFVCEKCHQKIKSCTGPIGYGS